MGYFYQIKLFYIFIIIKFDKMLKNLLNLIYPRLCVGCNALLLTNETTICSKCLHHLPYTYHWKNHKNDTTKKFEGLLPIEFGISFLYFQKEGIVQEAIHKLKYKGKQEVGTILGNLMSAEIKEFIINQKVDAIIPVPLHPKRLKERGYNQVESFGKAISKNLNIAYNDSLLIRNVYTKTQTQKDKDSRQYNKENIFECKFQESDYNKHYLLIDDIITTGATLEKCGKAILKIPNSKVSILTIGYTQS